MVKLEYYHFANPNETMDLNNYNLSKKLNNL